MSIIAREWVLCQDLAPVHKLVLVVLGDAADDQGLCWPRVSTVAEKVGVSTRTVQRALHYLVRRKMITVEPRMRSDGSSSSNLYRLRIRESANLPPPPDRMTPHHDKLTPPPVFPVTHPRHRCQGEGDTRVTPLTERRTEREPPPRKPVPKVEPKTPDRGSGKVIDLHYPKNLLSSERIRAEGMIRAVDPPLNQQVLDEWAGIIAAGGIRSSPLGCLRALIQHAKEGTFTQERGLRIAQARQAERRVQAQVTKLPELAPADESSPLVCRMRQVAQRQGKG